MPNPSLAVLRRRLRAAWVLVAVVPLATAAGFVVGPLASRIAGLALLAIAVLATVISPALVYLPGFIARARRPSTADDPPTLGRVAVGLHVATVGVLLAALVYIVRATQDPSMASLGFLVGAFMFGLLSLLPWLGSVITGGLFSARSLRATSM